MSREIGPKVCRRDQKNCNILSMGEELVFSNGGSSPIPKWCPKGLQVPFQKNHISISEMLGTDGLSDVTRLPSKQKQKAFLDGFCLNIPETLCYQKLVWDIKV